MKKLILILLAFVLSFSLIWIANSMNDFYSNGRVSSIWIELTTYSSEKLMDCLIINLPVWLVFIWQLKKKS